MKDLAQTLTDEQLEEEAEACERYGIDFATGIVSAHAKSPEFENLTANDEQPTTDNEVDYHYMATLDDAHLPPPSAFRQPPSAVI